MRYTGEVRFRFVGSREECIKYIPDARKVLGMLHVQDRELGGLDQAFRRVILANGVVIEAYANTTIPILTIDASQADGIEREPETFNFRLAWYPEGILITPVSDDYPDGWGLPTRDPDTGEVIILADANPQDPDSVAKIGTDGGVWPQVLINQYENNKYLDKKEFITGLGDAVVGSLAPENPLLREAWDTPFNDEGVSIQLHFGLRYNPRAAPWDVDGVDDGLEFWTLPENLGSYTQVPGVYLGDTLVYPQFGSYLRDDLIYELESNEWFAHRPEEQLYLYPAQEGLFQYTNTLRTDLGRGEMHRVVRGHTNVARHGAQEVALSGLQWHDNEDFRPGYRTEEQKVRAGSGYVQLAGENLLIASPTLETFTEGEAVGMLWENSPVHYANMILSDWTEDADIPGAEHFNAAMPAVVEESESGGEFDPPITGWEWTQTFTRQAAWVLTPFQYHYAGGRLAAGSLGMVNEYARDAYYGPDYLFVSFAGELYPIANDLFETDAMAVFGAAMYLDPEDGERKLRAVVCTSDYAVDPAPNAVDFEDFTLYVITMPVRVTDIEPDWTIEDQVDYLEADDWIPAMQGGVKFSPDGTKFVFTMLVAEDSYTEGLDYDAENFTTERSALENPRYSVAPVHIEYDSSGSEGFRFTENKEITPFALVSTGTTGVAGNPGHYSWYTRSLVGQVALFADYDDDGSLIYAVLHVAEYGHQDYSDEGGDPEYTNYCYRVRYLEFPSGKRVYTTQQYLRNYETVTDPITIATDGWNVGDETGDNFIALIHHLNVRHEDVVYTKRETRHDLYFQENAVYPQWYEHGAIDIVADLGFDDFNVAGDQVQERYIENLYHEDDQYFGDADIAPAYTDFIVGEGEYGTKIDTSAGIYQYDTTPGHRTLVLLGTAYRPALTLPLPWIGLNIDAQSDPELLEFPAYNGHSAWTVDHIQGRPPYAGYRVSTNLGIDQRFPRGFSGKSVTFGSGLFLGSSAIPGKSFLTCNIAPIMLNEACSICQVVRYKDRVVLRLENRLWPWAGQGAFDFKGSVIPGTRTPIIDDADDASEIAADWVTVPDGADVLIWANFDIDEATGMSDVTDIEPLGRAG